MPPVPSLHDVNYPDGFDVLEVAKEEKPEGSAAYLDNSGLIVVVTQKVDMTLSYDLPEDYEVNDRVVRYVIRELQDTFDNIIESLIDDGWGGVEHIGAVYEDATKDGRNAVELIIYLYA